MKLVIVESPTKAKTLAKFLPKGFQIEATLGHIRDLPQTKLGVDVKNNFKPQYIIPKARQDTVKKLKKVAKTADKIVLATDPDREGEAIAWHTIEIIKNAKFKKPANFFDRITFHEITSPAVKKALEKPGSIDLQLVDAQQARRILDRLVGYKLSPLLWKKLKKGLSAGRVQSVAVRLIVEREKEIKDFVPVIFWEIDVVLQKQTGKYPPFIAKLEKINNKKAEIKSQKQADSIAKNLEKSTFKISDLEKKEQHRCPYPPFTTSTMQQAGANLLNWTAKKTMIMAQRLFEQGFITYHRTDSVSLSSQAIKKARAYISKNFNAHYLPASPNLYKTKSRVAQEAHEAIRPTKFDKLENTENNIREKIGRDAVRLYNFIFKKTIASQMTPAVYDKVTVKILAAAQKDNYLLKVKGSKKIFAGWLAIYGKDRQNDKDQILPPLKVYEKLDLVDQEPIKVAKKQTQPPPRYSEASLIKTLEEYDIGRPSTYAPTISTIKERLYVEVEEKKLKPTFLGTTVIKFLVKYFSDILDYKFTAQIEKDLDEIANGEKQWQPIISAFYLPFEKKLKKVTASAKKIDVTEKAPENEKCEKCGAKLIIRYGRFGRFLACSKFPDCKFTKTITQETDLKCPECDGKIIIRQTKRRKKFYGCSNYPKCKFASWTKPKT